jgi:hypothetical protein
MPAARDYTAHAVMSWARRLVTWGLALTFVHVCVVDIVRFTTAVLQGGTPEYRAELKKRKRIGDCLMHDVRTWTACQRQLSPVQTRTACVPLLQSCSTTCDSGPSENRKDTDGGVASRMQVTMLTKVSAKCQPS